VDEAVFEGAGIRTGHTREQTTSRRIFLQPRWQTKAKSENSRRSLVTKCHYCEKSAPAGATKTSSTRCKRLMATSTPLPIESLVVSVICLLLA